MNYLTNTFAINNNDNEKIWRYKKNDNVINIVCNPKSGKTKEINGEVTTYIMNLREYTQKNEEYLKISYDNFLSCMILKFKIEQMITRYNLLVDEDYYKWTIINNSFKISFQIYKITTEIYLTIEFFNEEELNLSSKLVSSEQLLLFLENNKNIFNQSSCFAYQEPIDSEIISTEYSKLFIKRCLQERIRTQMGKDTWELEKEKYNNEFQLLEKDNQLKMLQKKFRKCLNI
jgi:hypothetical protein